MNTLPTRQDLSQLLTNTGITWSEPKPTLERDTLIWTALALIHFTLLLGIGGLLVRLWPLTHY